MNRYFDDKISHGFVSLYTGKMIVMIGTGLLGIFLPIFLFNLFDKNFQLTILYFGTGYILYALFVAFGTGFLNKFGFRRALRISAFLGALFYAIFYFISQENFIYLLPFSLLVLTVFRIFYWIPYHVDFAKFTDKKNRGREVSAISATRNVIGVFVPLVAGFIISRFNFDVLFIIVIILYLISFIPYLTIPHTKEKFSWSYLETWKQFFSKKRRETILAFMADGAEEVVGFIVWPIFIFQLLNGDYFKVGAISTLIIGVVIVLQLALGKYIDVKKQKEKILYWGSALYSLGWIIKIFIVTAFQLFVVGAYHSLARIFTRTPFDALTYEIAADEGHYVDEFTVLHEMAIQTGKFLMAGMIIIVSLFFVIQWTFILAAAAVIFLNLLRAKNKETIPSLIR